MAAAADDDDDGATTIEDSHGELSTSTSMLDRIKKAVSLGVLEQFRPHASTTPSEVEFMRLIELDSKAKKAKEGENDQTQENDDSNGKPSTAEWSAAWDMAVEEGKKKKRTANINDRFLNDTCSSLASEFRACNSPTMKMQHYYRYGEFGSCSIEQRDLYLCFKSNFMTAERQEAFWNAWRAMKVKESMPANPPWRQRKEPPVNFMHEPGEELPDYESY